MIKKNDMKMKTSNKRLFSDISSHNTIPINTTLSNNLNTSNTSANIATTPTAVITNVKAAEKANEDETDGKIKVPRITPLASTQLNRSLNTSNFLNKIVSNTKLGSTPNSNLVTMVIGSSNSSNTSSSTNTGSSILTLGSNFARKLQNIQNERADIK